MLRFGNRERSVLVLALLTLGTASARSDTLIYNGPGGRRAAEGQLTARTSEELLFLGRDGQMHLVDAERLIELRRSPQAAQPVSKQEMTQLLRAEFGREFAVHSTAHYLICYNSDAAFARSCGRLFERLHRGFTNYFTKQGFQIQPSPYPLVAVVFGNERDFRAYAENKVGEEMANHVIGYYSFLTNRMALYDIQATKARVALGNVAGRYRKRPPRSIDSYTEVNVATIIHEATHQLAYNSGFHRRFSDNPLWLAEGMAMYFETVDRRSGSRKGIGAVNRLRMQLFRQEYLRAGRPPEITSLILTDDRLRDSQSALLAYAESWALTYFLLRTHREEFHQYLQILAKKPPLAQDTPEQRLADFKAAFGEDIRKLETRFLQYMRNVR